MIEPWSPSEGIPRTTLGTCVTEVNNSSSHKSLNYLSPNTQSRQQDPSKKGANYESLLSKNHDTLMKAPTAKRICLKRVTCSSSSKSSLSTTCHAIILRAFGKTQEGPVTDEGAGLVVDSKMQDNPHRQQVVLLGRHYPTHLTDPIDDFQFSQDLARAAMQATRRHHTCLCWSVMAFPEGVNAQTVSTSTNQTQTPYIKSQSGLFF